MLNTNSNFFHKVKLILASLCLVFLFLGINTATATVYSAPALGDGCANAQSGEACLKKNPLVKQIQTVVNFLSAGVGLIIIIGVIAGGIRYITAGDSPQQVQSAKDMIRNAITALIIFALMYSFLQWLIPGGAF